MSHFVSKIDTPFQVEVFRRSPCLRLVAKTYLIEVDDRLPKLVVQLVEISHTNFPKVARMVLVEIRSVMMLSTSHTTSTRMLSVLANTAVAGGDVAPATRLMSVSALPSCLANYIDERLRLYTYCLRVFVNRVGIVVSDGGKSEVIVDGLRSFEVGAGLGGRFRWAR